MKYSAHVTYMYMYMRTCTCTYVIIFQNKKDVGMAVPTTTETRRRDGSYQAKQVIQRL